MPENDLEESEISKRLYEEGIERQRKRVADRDCVVRERDQRSEESKKRADREASLAKQASTRRQEELSKMSSSPIIDAEWRELNLCKNNQ
jgi:hypothetical protein